MAPPNWDDQFDFDQIDNKPKNKPKDIKKIKKQQDDFFDLDDQTQNKKSNKLPVINNKNQSVQIKNKNGQVNNKKSKNIYDQYEEIDQKIQNSKSPAKSKGQKIGENYSFIEQLQESNNKSLVKNNNNKNSKPIEKQKKQQEQEYYEELEDIAQSPKIKQTNKQKQSEKKQQQYEDDYQQDFQQIEKIPEKQLVKKSQKQISKPAKSQQKIVNQPKKPPLNPKRQSKQQVAAPKQVVKQNLLKNNESNKNISQNKIPLNQVSNQNIAPKKLQKSSSKKSIKSNDSKKGKESRSISKNISEFVVNKHIKLVQKNFPQSDDKLNLMSIDKLNRVNEQIRDMIKTFNQQLNELIDKNMILLKQKPAQKSVSVQNKMVMYQQQLKTGQTALNVVANQLQRLKDQQGKFRQQQFQLIIQKNIEQTKQQIKQTNKLITKLKYQVDFQGKKLSKQQFQKKMAQQLHQIKTMLIQAKKDDERQTKKIQNLDAAIQQLQTKNNDKQYQISQQIDTAKQKGINMNIKQQTIKKYQELKSKITANQNHKKAIQGLTKIKCDQIVHQNQQIKTTIRSIQSQVINLAQSVQHVQQQSKKLIKSAQQNSKISTSLSQNLQKLLKSIQQSRSINLFDIRTQGNHSRASQRPLKASMYQKGNSKQKNSRNQSSSKKQPDAKSPQMIQSAQSDDVNMLKPTFTKKKEKITDIMKDHNQQIQKVQERVWKDQQKKQNQNKAPTPKINDIPAVQTQQDKKKPFMFKKNKAQQQQKSQEQIPSPKKEQTKPLKLQQNIKPQTNENIQQPQKPSIGPRLMRLNKNKGQNKINDISGEKPTQIVQNIKIPQSKKQTPKLQEEQAVIVPKRFNLRNKIQKKQQTYQPTIDKKQQKKQQKKQYAPNFSFKQQDPYKKPQKDIPKIIQQPKKIEQSEQKPKFTLRLRDRQKKQAQNNEYIPTRITQPQPKIETKIETSNNPRTSLLNKQRQQDNFNNLNKINNPSIKKQQNNNIYSINKQEKQQQIKPKQIINNPYAPKQDAPKRQKEGPIKKIKIQKSNQPKPKINIYQQAQDLTQNLAPAVQEPPPPINKPSFNPAKSGQLDLNAMLGIKKQKKANDLDDLLGDFKVDKKKQKKKATDFFNDLEL